MQKHYSVTADASFSIIGKPNHLLPLPHLHTKQKQKQNRTKQNKTKNLNLLSLRILLFLSFSGFFRCWYLLSPPPFPLSACTNLFLFTLCIFHTFFLLSITCNRSIFVTRAHKASKNKSLTIFLLSFFLCRICLRLPEAEFHRLMKDYTADWKCPRCRGQEQTALSPSLMLKTIKTEFD